MKESEVKIGDTCYTYVGQALTKVVVVGTVAKNPNSVFSKRNRFIVSRVGASAPLPKPRTAAALRKFPSSVLVPGKVLDVVVSDRIH